MDSDDQIDTFRQTLERAAALQGQLDSIKIALARRDELPDLIESCRNGTEARWLREELAAGAHPLSYRIRWSRMESELREVLGGAGATMRGALDAAAQLVTAAAGGAAVTASPFVRRHLGELARHRTGPPLPATPDSRMAHIRAAWRAIDAAVAAVPEIQFEARR